MTSHGGERPISGEEWSAALALYSKIERQIPKGRVSPAVLLPAVGLLLDAVIRSRPPIMSADSFWEEIRATTESVTELRNIAEAALKDKARKG